MPPRPTATPAALVEATIAGLLELTVPDLISAVGTRAIAARAGVSPASLFHHFGSTQALALAVLARVFDPRRPPPELEIGTGVAAISSSSLPSDTSVHFHAGEYDRLSADVEHPLRIGLWALGGEAGRQAYGVYMRERDAPLHRAALDLYDGWGRELRPPVSAARFVALHAALLNGAVIRGSVDEAGLDRAAFARSAAALSLVMLRMKGERRDLDDRLAEINYFPLPDPGTRHHRAERMRPRRSRVLAAAHSIFWELGYEGTTIGEVARAAEVSPSTVHALFDGKADLAVHCLMEEARAHLGSDPQPWRERLAGVAALLARSAHLTTPYAEELVAGVRLRADDVVRDHVAAALRDGAALGELTADAPLDDLAHTLLTVLLGRLLTKPAEGADGAQRWVQTVLLAGLAGRAG
jgi:AcrR family transcriptional regulator